MIFYKVTSITIICYIHNNSFVNAIAIEFVYNQHRLIFQEITEKIGWILQKESFSCVRNVA